MIAAQPPAVDAYSIFARARMVWSMQRYPGIVSYTVEVDAMQDGILKRRHYHEYWSTPGNRVFVKPPVSDEQLADPYKPSPGVNFMGWNIGGPREGSGAKDFIGVPDLTPNYSFGISDYTPPSQLTPAQIVEQIRREYHDPSPQKIAELEQRSGLKTIAVVSSIAHAYRITLAGIEPESAGPAYHLRLQPLSDPLTYRLRDIWIDTSSFATERARIGANFTDSATEGVPWIVRFAQISGATYIASETAEQPIVGFHGLMYSQYSVLFSIGRSNTLPPFAGLTSLSEPLLEP